MAFSLGVGFEDNQTLTPDILRVVVLVLLHIKYMLAEGGEVYAFMNRMYAQVRLAFGPGPLVEPDLFLVVEDAFEPVGEDQNIAGKAVFLPGRGPEGT